MSLKAIDMQMAIHRNDEAGLRQNQLQHKPEIDQSQLGEQALKTADRERERTAKLEESAEPHIQAGDKDESHGKRNRERNRRQQNASDSEDAKTPPHPFKGHLFDVSL